MVNPFEGREAFEHEVFEGLALEQADLSGREFYKCVFRASKLGETRWRNTSLESCTFEHCDLTRADLMMLSLRDVVFKHCKLMGIDFTNVAKHPSASFEDCNLRYASMVSLALRKTTFQRCALVETNLFEVDLTDSTFEDCELTGARFERCTLRGARFPGARDLFIDPARNQVKGAQIPLEAAILLATSFGMRVIGFSGSKDRKE